MRKIIGLFLTVILVLTACGGNKTENKAVEQEQAQKVSETQTEEKKTIKYVAVEAAQMREMSKLFESDITLEPKDKIEHSTEKGGTIKKIYKNNGDFAKKGEVVVTLTDAATESAFLSAKANLQTAQSSFNIAKNNYDKFKSLYDRELVSYLEYSSYETSLISAKGNLEVAQANYENAGNDYSKLTRRADTDGLVGNLFVKEGNKVGALETIFTVLNDSKMQAYVGVSPEAISKINKGDSIQVRVEALNKEYEAKIDELNPIADSTTKNFRIKLLINNANKEIKDGMYGNVVIPIGKENVLSIEDEAVFVRNLESYVFKYENGKVTQVKVNVGATNLPYTEISAPEIKEGDKIVVKGLFGLQDNDEVEIKNEEAN